MGPTGIGKTNISLKFSEILPIEIINVDASMIYKDMNIGTNKPSIYEQMQVKHNLLNILNPSKSYSFGLFYFRCKYQRNRSNQKKKIPVLVGGSISYFNAIYNGLVSMPEKNFQQEKNQELL